MRGADHFHHVLGGFVGGKFGLEFFFFGRVHESWQDMVIKWLFLAQRMHLGKESLLATLSFFKFSYFPSILFAKLR